MRDLRRRLDLPHDRRHVDAHGALEVALERMIGNVNGDLHAGSIRWWRKHSHTTSSGFE